MKNLLKYLPMIIGAGVVLYVVSKLKPSTAGSPQTTAANAALLATNALLNSNVPAGSVALPGGGFISTASAAYNNNQDLVND